MDISVIIPTYHTQRYFLDCMASLMRQTFDHSRFEIIIVLNGEKEPYETVVSQAADIAEDISVRTLYSAASGVSNARNIAIDEARGRYLCFIDDDDWVSPCFLEEAFRTANNNLNIIAQSNVVDFHETENKCSDNYITRAFRRNKALSRSTLLTSRSFMSSACDKLIPREIIGDRRFPNNFKRLEDAMFMAMLSDKVESIRLTSEDALYYYRMRDGSASHTKLPFTDFLKENIGQINAFVRIYLSNPKGYSLPFFCTRILAVCRTIMKRMLGRSL